MREVAAIATTLASAGEDGMSRRALGDALYGRRWGPGRYRHALAIALSEGRIRRTRRDRYVAG